VPEITIISGKGGTGKTSLTAAFAHLAQNHVICDLDVDAPDLHLLLDPEHEKAQEFYSGHTAVIDRELCTNCGQCLELCRFTAIAQGPEGPIVDPIACEGCKVCVHFCPAQAINWQEDHCGRWYISRTRFGPMVHAQLFPGEENSGKLVALLRERARAITQERNLDLILSDGAPGLGCPVISSLSGTDLAVIVTEPTPSGVHDLDRVADLCAHFRIPAGVLINKWDLNADQSQAIERLCLKKGLNLVGKLPFDTAFTQAMVQRMVITEFQNDGPAEAVRTVWRRIRDLAGLRAAA